MGTANDQVANIAVNIGVNLGGCAFMLGKLVELIEADDARDVREIEPETRQAASDALRDAKTHWGKIGGYTNALDDKLPPPTPMEDPDAP